MKSSIYNSQLAKCLKKSFLVYRLIISGSFLLDFLGNDGNLKPNIDVFQ